MGILGKLLESDSSKAMKFNELFEAVQSIKEMKVIEVHLSAVLQLDFVLISQSFLLV